MHPLRVALIIAGLLAAGAFYPNHSYNYFILLKWVLFATSIWAAVLDGESKQSFALVVFGAIALIHNPILKFHFEREVWLVIDGITSAWMIFKSITIKLNKK